MLTQHEEVANSVAVITSCGPHTPVPFITQAQKPATGSKRKSLLPRELDAGHDEDEDEQTAKRERHAVPTKCDSSHVEEGQCVETGKSSDPAETRLDNSDDTTPSASGEEQQPTKGTLFSPLYPKGSNCTQNGAACEAAEAHEGTWANENQCQELEHNYHPHAHHPPPPEVPEAAESDYDEDESEDDCLSFDPLAFIRSLPSLEEVVPRFRKALLPKQTRQCKQKTLVLDLDETLVHSSLDTVVAPDFSFPVQFNNQEHTIHVRQRPYLHKFMSRVSELFEIVVFTASQKIYAEKLLNIIDPKHQYIKHRIYRDSCVIVDGNYLKDLSVLGRDLACTLIVDNSPQAFGFQIDNGVPIESWYEDPADQELSKLLPFLESLVDVDDVRPHIAKKFRLRELISGAN